MKIGAALTLGMVIGGVAVWLTVRPPTVTTPTVTAAVSPALPVVAAAQGRVEGRTKNIEVEASVDGVIRSLSVKEGQIISKDGTIGEIACDNLGSEVRALEASRESAVQTRVRLLRGSREEERRVADQDVLSAEAIVAQAGRQNDRMQFLAVRDEVSQQTADSAKRDLATAEAGARSALEKQKLANAGPLPEEVSKANADVASAEERVHAAVAQREKCIIRAPIRGTITRVNMRIGEAFSTVLPRPIVTMADLSERRIRAEVDERDLGKVEINQRVRISAEGFREPFAGKVIWTSVVMGRKTARSTDPAERSDRDILETLIAPERAAWRLPIGLRVVVEFLSK
jgi:HlyD family secretion protein